MSYDCQSVSNIAYLSESSHQTLSLSHGEQFVGDIANLSQATHYILPSISQKVSGITDFSEGQPDHIMTCGYQTVSSIAFLKGSLITFFVL